jgi:hypothetical protein
MAGPRNGEQTKSYFNGPLIAVCIIAILELYLLLSYQAFGNKESIVKVFLAGVAVVTFIVGALASTGNASKIFTLIYQFSKQPIILHIIVFLATLLMSIVIALIALLQNPTK